MPAPKKLPECFDSEFIQAWHSTYNLTECDQGEYERLLSCVSEDLSKDKMTWSTFHDILTWKSKRIKGLLQGKGKSKEDQKVYTHALNKCRLAPEDAKIQILADLQGIGIPTASTVLHFMYPHRFPISDVRTIQVLNYFKENVHKSQSLNGYKLFRACLLRLQTENPKWNLRQLDMALFGFHKLNKELFKKKY